MATKPVPSPEVLRQSLLYEPETGKLYWRTRSPEMFQETGKGRSHKCAGWNSRYAGREALTAVGSHGYRTGNVNDMKVLAHRAIFALVVGVWPKEEVDHINGDKLDNRWCNLRAASSLQNKANRSLASIGACGAKGVTAHRGLFRARITHDQNRFDLGCFNTIEEASKAYMNAASKLRGRFMRRAE